MPASLEWLGPKKGGGKAKRFGTFDIETYGKQAGPDLDGTFAFAYTCWHTRDGECLQRHDSLAGLMDYVLDTKTPDDWHCWNLKYDGQFAIAELYERGVLGAQQNNGQPRVRVQETNGRWYQIQIALKGKRGIVRLRDARNYYESSLEDAVKSYGLPHEKISIRWDEVTPWNKRLLADLRRHCMSDCRATYQLVALFFQFCRRLGVLPRLTTSSTAIALLRVRALKHKIPMIPKEFHHWLQPAKFGGRVEVYQQRHDGRYWNIDVNSLYPECYRRPLPWARPYFCMVAPGAIPNLEHLGFVHCTVHVPKQEFPPLPARESNGRVVYRHGIIEGIWYTEELKEAIEHHAVQVLIVHKALLWRISGPVLAPYADLLEGVKRNAPTPGERQLAKLFRNAITGKFAESWEVKETRFDPFPTELYSDPRADFIPTDYTAQVPYWVMCGEERRGHHLPHFYAAITALARMTMLRHMRRLRCEGAKIIYMDTDGLIIDQAPPPALLGVRDGQFKVKTSGRRFRAPASKTCLLGQDSQPDIVFVKGFPDRSHTLGEREFVAALAKDFTDFRGTWLRQVFDASRVALRLVPMERRMQTLDTKRRHLSSYKSEPRAAPPPRTWLVARLCEVLQSKIRGP